MHTKGNPVLPTKSKSWTVSRIINVRCTHIKKNRNLIGKPGISGGKRKAWRKYAHRSNPAKYAKCASVSSF